MTLDMLLGGLMILTMVAVVVISMTSDRKMNSGQTDDDYNRRSTTGKTSSDSKH